MPAASSRHRAASVCARAKTLSRGLRMLSPEEIAANPIGTDLIYEDERIRVWRIELAPGEVAGFHTHELDYTTVVVDGDAVVRRPARTQLEERRDEAVPERDRRDQGPAGRRCRANTQVDDPARADK